VRTQDLLQMARSYAGLGTDVHERLTLFFGGKGYAECFTDDLLLVNRWLKKVAPLIHRESDDSQLLSSVRFCIAWTQNEVAWRRAYDRGDDAACERLQKEFDRALEEDATVRRRTRSRPATTSKPPKPTKSPVSLRKQPS
jgi:hypothetical protein